MKEWQLPEKVFAEYEQGNSYKAMLGTRGLAEQNKTNERFFVGDQWHGAKCGRDRPLVRYNVIKRIGDYKMAVVGSNPIAVGYSADGVPNTLAMKEGLSKARENLSRQEDLLSADEMFSDEVPTSEEINLVMSAMSDYFRVTAERVKFEDVKEQALRDAYISGTGVVYTYWDSSICTGLYADKDRKTPIVGDIACECIDIENVVFGDPTIDSIQKQPYIILAQRKGVDEIRRIARADNRPQEEIERITADSDTNYQAGQYGEREQDGTRRAVLLTKLYKKYDKDGRFKIMAVQVCRGVTVRKAWDIGIRLYPLAKFSWERRKNCAYGESEVTYLIPNQIAINRMITASVWAVMMMGMPIMLVNGDLVQQQVTNDPGQIIRVFGGTNDIQTAIRFLNPPNFSPNFDNNVASLISNTLTQAGANDALLGNMNPENTSAIIAVREAATLPLQTVQNRFYSFVEDIARIWAEFWTMHYGDRYLKIEDSTGTWFMPFKGDRYKDLLISARIDVGASTLWSEAQSIRTLDNLFERQVIDVIQYLKRLPKGTVPNVTELIAELERANQLVAKSQATSDAVTPPSEDEVLSGLEPEMREIFDSLPPEKQREMLHTAIAEGGINDAVDE